MPRVEQVESYRLYHTINGYAHSGLRPDVSDPDKDTDWDAGHKWTEYFDVDFDMVVDNPDYDPDAEPGEINSNKDSLRTHAEYLRCGDFFFRSASNI